MKGSNLLLPILLFNIFNSHAHEVSTDTIYYHDGFSLSFYQHDQRLNLVQVLDIMEPVNKAYSEMRSAQNNYLVSKTFSTAGGLLVMWPLVQSIAGKQANWNYAIAGGGLFVVSMPFGIRYRKRAVSAVGQYNASLPPH